MIDHPLAGTPYGTALELSVALAAACWVLTLLTRDHSWVDRLWSIVPAVLCLIVAVDLGFDSPRVNIMTALAVLWGLRLTYNLALKGGYRVGRQDYRWTYLREQLGAVKFQVLNLTFIAFGQIAILWLFTSPIHQAWEHAEQPLGWLDAVAAGIFLLLLLTETIADAQMWRFQQNKKRLVSEGAEVRQPFMTAGLFRFCRHPSYACEMGMWAAFYLFAVSGPPRSALAGWLSLVVLFCAARGRAGVERTLSRLRRLPGCCPDVRAQSLPRRAQSGSTLEPQVAQLATGPLPGAGSLRPPAPSRPTQRPSPPRNRGPAGPREPPRTYARSGAPSFMITQPPLSRSAS